MKGFIGILLREHQGLKILQVKINRFIFNLFNYRDFSNVHVVRIVL